MKIILALLASVQAAEAELKGTPCTVTGDYCTAKDCASGCSSKTYAIRNGACVKIDKIYLKTTKCTEKDVEIEMFSSEGCAGQTTGKMLMQKDTCKDGYKATKIVAGAKAQLAAAVALVGVALTMQ